MRKYRFRIRKGRTLTELLGEIGEPRQPTPEELANPDQRAVERAREASERLKNLVAGIRKGNRVRK